MTADNIRHIDFGKLPISDYSRSYILRMLPHLDYYLDIYNRCLDRMAEALGRPLSDVTLVDYGGGHGFLSCLAKSRGAGRVIYVDVNPQAVEAAGAVSRALGCGPDVLLQGDAGALLDYVRTSRCKPDALLGMDVIEHIYRLPDFFAALHEANPAMRMIFTTGSTPFNPHVTKRLHRVMRRDEEGHDGKPGFYDLRRQAIARQFPLLSGPELDVWAACTRGLNYQDTLLAVERREPYAMADAFNTCDPATGSWTERILPISGYESATMPFGWKVSVASGFYNTHRDGAKALPSRLLNLLLRTGGFLFLAPFIILTVNR